jgi:dipeptidyl aminopeptidase/acylaminoacyl peptidase
VPFVWSPDGAYLAVVGQPLSTMLATGLWLYDIEADSWRNLTGHDYDGPLTATDDSPGPPPGTAVEVQPAWSPDGEQIAVVRAVIDDAGRFGPAHLALIDAGSGDVRELPLLPAPDDHAAPGAVTGLEWSPGGAELAVSLWHRDSAPDHNGLWLFDIAAEEYQQLTTEADARAAFHDIYDELELTSAGPLKWSPDGSRLLLWAGAPGQQPVAVWPFLVDRDSGELAAVPLPLHPNDTGTRRNIRPHQAAWSPDGAVLMVFALGLHPDEDRRPLDPDGGSVRASVRLVDVAHNSETALGHLPLGPSAALYFAAWGADGDVIINGYRLRLTAD